MPVSIARDKINLIFLCEDWIKKSPAEAGLFFSVRRGYSPSYSGASAFGYIARRAWKRSMTICPIAMG